MIKNIIEKNGDYFYFIFRVFVGLLFFQHGAKKLFGAFGAEESVVLLSLMGLVGIIEFVGGLSIAFGFFARFAALISAVVMLFAYFMSHLPRGIIPIMNRGELSLLYFAAFLVIIVYGAKKWGLEKFLLKKEIF